MSEFEAKLFSHAVLRMRSVRLRYEDQVAKACRLGDYLKLHDAITKLLNDCTLEVVDRGGYPQNHDALTEDGKLDWRRAFDGDRAIALANIRAESYPKDGGFYEVHATCDCYGRSERYEIDVRDGFPVRFMSDEVREQLELGQPFIVESDGYVFEFRHDIGDDHRTYAKLLKQCPDRVITAALTQRILAVRNAKTNEQVCAKEDIVSFLDGRSLDGSKLSKRFEGVDACTAQDLREAFDMVDFGMDSITVVTCRHCDEKIQVEVPFSNLNFLPNSVRARKRLMRLEAFGERDQ